MSEWRFSVLVNSFTKSHTLLRNSVLKISLQKAGFASYMRRKRNYYDVLDVPYDATDEEIKTAFIEKSQELHPDGKNFNPQRTQSIDKYSPDFTEQFMELKIAYDILHRPARRKQYDRMMGIERLKRFDKRLKNTQLYHNEEVGNKRTFAMNGMTLREFVGRDFYLRLADHSDNSLMYFTAGGLAVVLILQKIYVWYLESDIAQNTSEIDAES